MTSPAFKEELTLRRDIIIIGGGPGGYVAAIRAAQLGASVTVIEKAQLGGTCLNWGCIPTKALYQNAQVIHTLTRSEEFGVLHNGFSIDMDKIQERKNRVVTQLRDGISHLLRAYDVEYIEGHAIFASPQQIDVELTNGEKLSLDGESVIIATGSVPSRPPFPGIDLPGVINSDGLLEIEKIPESMVIIGGGVIGMEFASIFSAFGTEVTVIEFMPRILPLVDKDIVTRLAATLRKKGIKFSTNTRVKEILQDGESLKVVAEGKQGDQHFNAEKVLVATGRNINVTGLNLEGIGVQYDRQGITVDERFATNVAGVYAIGDVIGGMMLAHVASDEGKACVEYILGHKGHINYDAVPSVVFTSPEVATVGLTEEEATEKGLPLSVGRFLYGANSKAVAMGEESGIVKVIARADTKEIIGAHIFGYGASTMIHEAALAVENKLTVDDVARTIHAHPTLSEAFLEAVLAVDDRAIHAAPPRPRKRT